MKFWTEAKVKFGRRFEVELKRLLRSESSSPKMIFNQSSSVLKLRIGSIVVESTQTASERYHLKFSC